MAVAGWCVWRRVRFDAGRKALAVFGVQLGLNLAWSFLFFGLQQIGLALAEVVILLLAIIANTILFWRIDRLTGALFVPYVLWAAYVTMLNVSIFLLNTN